MERSLLIPGLEHRNAAPDAERLKAILLRRHVPERSPIMELFQDDEVQSEILGRTVTCAADRIEVQYRLGYDTMQLRISPPFKRAISVVDDTAALTRNHRDWRRAGEGMIQTLQDVEDYPWPFPTSGLDAQVDEAATALPGGMALMLRSSGVMENLVWLMSYDRLCEASCVEPELVEAVAAQVGQCLYDTFARVIDHDRVLGCFYGDDMGFKTSTMIAPDDLRRYVLPWHRRIATLCHDRGKLMILHTCGQRDAIMDDLIDEVKMDALHSFEDAIEPVASVKQRYGHRVSLVGGVDVDVLASRTPEEVTAYTRQVLEACAPGGGYALGSGNSIANYVRVENYFAMLRVGLG